MANLLADSNSICDPQCTEDQICNSGICMCKENSCLTTNGIGNSCIYTCASFQTCQDGNCVGEQCDSQNCEVFSNGKCVPFCNSAQSCHLGICICKADQCYTTDGIENSCVYECASFQTCQNGQCVGEQCNSQSCMTFSNGKCVSACTSAQTCNSGICTCNTNQCYTTNSVENTCVFECAIFQTCVNGTCQGVLCDSNSCLTEVNGKCQSGCNAGQICNSGICLCDQSQCFGATGIDNGCYYSCASNEICQNGNCQQSGFLQQN